VRKLLSNLEKRLEQWIEANTSSILRRKFDLSAIMEALQLAIHENALPLTRNRIQAPDQYVLALNEQTYVTLQKSAPDIQTELIHWLQEEIQTHEYLLNRSPVLSIVTDPTLSVGDFRISAGLSEQIDTTQELSLETVNDTLIPEDCFLIMNDQHLDLNEAVMNIGRRQDNHIIIASARVSRVHAQFRVRNGCFHILDLGSKSGTFVNGNPVHHHILQAGDVISIGDEQLIFVQDQSSLADTTAHFPALKSPAPQDSHSESSQME